MLSKVSPCLPLPASLLMKIFQVFLVSLLLLAATARPAHRSKRGLGLIKLGYDWATQGLCVCDVPCPGAARGNSGRTGISRQFGGDIAGNFGSGGGNEP